MKMKLIKIYLAVVTVLLLVGIGLGVYAWYTLQKLNTATSEVGGVPAGDTAPAPKPTVILDKPIVIKTSELPASQQKVLDTVGITADSFTITQDMVTCAEGAVGGTRMQEILDGSAPSPLESLKLLPCLKK
jgi:flagellar basal body-associated protein FliL